MFGLFRLVNLLVLKMGWWWWILSMVCVYISKEDGLFIWWVILMCFGLWLKVWMRGR